MAVLNAGLGGTSGYGEQSFKTTGGYSGSLDDGSRQVDISGVFGCGAISTSRRHHGPQFGSAGHQTPTNAPYSA